jgi:hypothetical protein
MANIGLTLYTDGFFGSVLKSPSQMGSLSIHNSVTNISRLGTFKAWLVHVDPDLNQDSDSVCRRIKMSFKKGNKYFHQFFYKELDVHRAGRCRSGFT